MQRREFISAVALPLAGTIAFGLLFEVRPNPIPPDQQELRRPFAKVEYGTNAYQARVMFPSALSDRAPEQGEPTSVSTVALYEDSERLGPAHGSFKEIGTHGGGRFIFGQDTQSKFVIFSASDNSDPNTNGRTYRIKDENWHDLYPTGRPPCRECS